MSEADNVFGLWVDPRSIPFVFSCGKTKFHVRRLPIELLKKVLRNSWLKQSFQLMKTTKWLRNLVISTGVLLRDFKICTYTVQPILDESGEVVTRYVMDTIRTHEDCSSWEDDPDSYHDLKNSNWITQKYARFDFLPLDFRKPVKKKRIVGKRRRRGKKIDVLKQLPELKVLPRLTLSTSYPKTWRLMSKYNVEVGGEFNLTIDHPFQELDSELFSKWILKNVNDCRIFSSNLPIHLVNVHRLLKQTNIRQIFENVTNGGSEEFIKSLKFILTNRILTQNPEVSFGISIDEREIDGDSYEFGNRIALICEAEQLRKVTSQFECEKIEKNFVHLSKRGAMVTNFCHGEVKINWQRLLSFERKLEKGKKDVFILVKNPDCWRSRNRIQFYAKCEVDA